MTALAALILGLLATAYAVWPALRGGVATRLSDDDDESAAEVEAAVAAVLLWGVAAGEIHSQADGSRNEG